MRWNLVAVLVVVFQPPTLPQQPLALAMEVAFLIRPRSATASTPITSAADISALVSVVCIWHLEGSNAKRIHSSPSCPMFQTHPAQPPPQSAGVRRQGRSITQRQRADLGEGCEDTVAFGCEDTVAFGELGPCWSHVATQDANIHRMDGRS